MKYELGNQYKQDDKFKAVARLHQSQYRSTVLNVDYDGYGNRLTDKDARKLLNYYDGLNVRNILKSRYPSYSKRRDADMLRSEHIPFNLFAPLRADLKLAKEIIWKAFDIKCKEIKSIEFEYAPKPKQDYLNDATSFDAYIKYLNERNELSGIGIEVKYTEKEYGIGKTEKKNVENPNSLYWEVTRFSKVFIDDANPILAKNAMRQIWRNHLLGLSMLLKKNIVNFNSITLYPRGNKHFHSVIPEYQALIQEPHRHHVFGCTLEKFISSIDGGEDFQLWRSYLEKRYIV